MQQLKDFNEPAHHWLRTTTSPEHWARCYFRSITKCDIVINNHTEAFNRQLLQERSKPILGLLEKLRMYLMMRMQARRQWISNQEDIICPRIKCIVEKLKEASADCIPTYAGRTQFQVKCGGLEQFAIDIGLRR